jgi:hypothetical protein
MATAEAEKPKETPAQDEPAAKKLKVSPPEPAVVRKQIEYYLSDENLKYDKFFHEKITSDKDGWLDLNLVLTCNKMKTMKATKEDVMAALKESKIEIRDDQAAVRRPGNAPLPKLEQRPQHQKKSSIHAHDGGVVACLSGIPEEQSWMQIKEKLKEKLPAKVQLWFVSEVNDKHQCFIATSPFEGDAKFFEDLELEAGNAKVKTEVCHNDMLHTALKLLPKHIRDKRERESRKRQKERNRPIVVGTQKFVNVAALRGRVKEILNSRSDGEQLKAEGTDFKLIKALLGYHPKGEAKSADLVGIKVGKSTQGDSRCFYMIKKDGTEEDFSAKKCLDAIEKDPPYVKTEPKAEPSKKEKAKGGDAAKGEAAKEEQKDDAAAKGEAAKDEQKDDAAAKAEEKKEEGEAAKEEQKDDAAAKGEAAKDEQKDDAAAKAEEKKEEEPPEKKAKVE